jgi:uncharacterized protein YjiS (DUF1127 family)
MSNENLKAGFPATYEGTDAYRRIDIDRVRTEAERLRGEAMAEAFRRLGIALARAARVVALGTLTVLQSAMRAAAAARVQRELSNLSDCELARLGITRDDIPRFVMAALDGEMAAGDPIRAATELRAIEGARAELARPEGELPRRRAA